MALRSMKSTVAHSMYEEVIGNPGFKEMDERSRAVWSVLGIYVQVLGMSSTDPVVVREANESIELEYQEIERLNDQLQQGNVLKKDIQGLKVAAVVARVIAMFMRGDYDGMVRRDESLQTLRRKRLRALHRGLDVFLRCIHAMVESNFQFAECQRRTQRLSAELRARDTQRKSDNEMLEILPFDRLWEVMMRMLRERQEAGSAHNSGTAPLRK